MIPKMISRVAPIGVDAALPEQGYGDVSLRSASEPTIKNLQNGGEASTTGMSWKVLAAKLSESLQIAQAFQRP
jgi:hypothetical protein